MVFTAISISCSNPPQVIISDEILFQKAMNANTKQERDKFFIKIFAKITDKKFIANPRMKYSKIQYFANKSLRGISYQKNKKLTRKLIHSNSPILREIAIAIIRRAYDKEGSALLIPLFKNDPFPKIRIKAMQALIDLQESVNYQDIIRMLNKWPDKPKLYRRALLGLKRLKAKESCPYIKQQIKIVSHMTKKNYFYIDAAVYIGCPQAVEILLKYLATNKIVKQKNRIMRHLYRFIEILSSTKFTKALINSYEKYQSIPSLIALVKSKKKSAIKYASTKVDGILANSAITEIQKDKLISSFFSTDDIDWINFAITKALSSNNIKLLNKILASLRSHMNSNTSGSQLHKNIKNKTIIVSRLIKVYSTQPLSARKLIADILRSSYEITDKAGLKMILDGEKSIDNQCQLLVPYVRLSTKSDLTYLSQFKHKKYDAFCQLAVDEFTRKLK